MAGRPRPTDVLADVGARTVLRWFAAAAALVTLTAADTSPPRKEPPVNQKTGVALFPPHGTKPLKRGLVVPDDFELPPGYVRHYQTTDDGKALPPILMFHPDFQPVDERGRPIPVPADRVVPPELAPAGMPIRMLDVPQPPTPDH